MSEQQSPPRGMRDRLNDDRELETFEEWRQSSGAAIHPSLGDKTYYDKQRVKFTVEKPPYQDLEAALAMYRNTEHIIEFDVKNCSWRNVLDQMREAQNVYNDKGEKNKVRGLFRHGMAISKNLTPWLDMIPDQYGLNVLRAGLTMIFKAVQKRGEQREKIFQAFEEIPDIIEKAQTKRETFPAEKCIQKCVQDLYETLLREIPELIKILLRQHKDPIIKRFIKQIPDQEETNVDDILKRVTRACRDLKSCTDDIVDKKIAKAEKNTTENLRETKAVRQTASSTHVRVGNISKDLKIVGEDVQAQREEAKAQFEQVEEKVQGKGEEVKFEIAQVKKSVDVNGKMIAAVGDQVEQLKKAVEQAQNTTTQKINPKFAAEIQTWIYYTVIEKTIFQDTYGPRIPSYNQKPLVSLEELLRILKVPHLTATEDLGHVLKQGNSIEAEALGHGRWLMTTENFKKWMAWTQSDLLLVDGHCDQAKTGKTSPMSVFCASLVATLVKLNPDILLHFFCGQHVALHDPLRGPHGLVRSLITQLLLYPKTQEPNLDFINSQQLYGDLAQHKLRALCHMFQQLVTQVPRGTTIYCIIDGISEYERRLEDSTEKLCYVVEELKGIVFNQNLGPIFKLLMTSANKSTEVIHQVPRKQHVSLRAGNVHSRPIKEQSLFKDIRRARTPVGNGRFPIHAPIPRGAWDP